MNFTASTSETLLESQDIALTKLGKTLRELNVPENAAIRIYASVELTPALQRKVHKTLVNESVNFSNNEFFHRVE